MKILPEYSFEKMSHLAPDEVIMRLKQRSEPSRDVFKYLKSGKIFAGQVLKDRFKLIRIDPLHWRNRPLIMGRVTATDSGSQITIKVGYHAKQSLFFMSVFFIFVFVALNSLISSLLKAAVITIVFAAVFIVIWRVEFHRECYEIEEAIDKVV